MHLERGISDCENQEAKNNKELFDLNAVSKRLDVFMDFTGCKVSNEMIEMFIERIIHRADDEFVWEMNLSGERSDARKCRISEFSKEHSEEPL